jgi:hypothetical protein
MTLNQVTVPLSLGFETGLLSDPIRWPARRALTQINSREKDPYVVVKQSDWKKVVGRNRDPDTTLERDSSADLPEMRAVTLTLRLARRDKMRELLIAAM